MRNPDLKPKNRLLIGLTVYMAVAALCAAGFNVTGWPEKIPQSVVEVPQSKTESLAVEITCKLISEGKFDAADEFITLSEPNAQGSMAQLARIIAEYKTIDKKRQVARQTAFQQHLDELEKLKSPSDVNDSTDPNDPNNISAILSTVFNATEYADEKQKAKLLSDTFVKTTFQQAIDKASEFEEQGKWLDAYIICYSWLQLIDDENKLYTDYADQLLEKANIVASFQDSPCETASERYEGVKKQSFLRAVEVLNFNYVSPLNYSQMAQKAIERCELLADVMQKIPDTNSIDQINKDALNDKNLLLWKETLKVTSVEIQRSMTGVSKDKFFDIFNKILDRNTATVQIPETILVAQFAEAALSALDSYTVMVWPRQVKDFEKLMTNEFTGIGIEITKQKGMLTVASLLPDTPAYNSGLDAEDVIEKVDGIETKDMSLTCAVHRITGPKGTNVILTIRRPGTEQTQDITITRDKITVPTIRGWQRTDAGKWLYMIDDKDKIGYIRITGFSEMTNADFEKALAGLEKQGVKGLVLDLRFNSGGYLESAIDITNKFVSEGAIVSTRPRWQAGTYARATKKGTHSDYPVVILINSGSASASEIVAGALADKVHQRAVLVGQRTHGKGSVQTITNRPGENVKMKYTMAYYYLPSNQRVESQDIMKKRGRKDWGVAPDIEVKLTGDELKNFIDVRRGNDVLVQIGHDNGSETPDLKKFSVQETLDSDPQMAIAVLVAKAKNIERQKKQLTINN